MSGIGRALRVLLATAIVASTAALAPARVRAAAPKPDVGCDKVDHTRVWFNYTLGQTFTTDLGSVRSWHIAVMGFKQSDLRISGRLMMYPAGDTMTAVGPGIVLAETTAATNLRGGQVRWLQFDLATPARLPLSGGTSGRYGIEVDIPVDATRKPGDRSELGWAACKEFYRGGRAFHVEGAESSQRRLEQPGTIPKVPVRLPRGGITRVEHQFQAFTFRVFGD